MLRPEQWEVICVKCNSSGKWGHALPDVAEVLACGVQFGDQLLHLQLALVERRLHRRERLFCERLATQARGEWAALREECALRTRTGGLLVGALQLRDLQLERLGAAEAGGSGLRARLCHVLRVDLVALLAGRLNEHLVDLLRVADHLPQRLLLAVREPERRPVAERRAHLRLLQAAQRLLLFGEVVARALVQRAEIVQPAK